MVGRVRSLAGLVDARAFPRSLADRRLLALLGTRLLEVAGDVVPEDLRRQVEEARAHGRMAAVVLEATLQRVVRRLEAAGIPALPLKGTRLAEEAHGDPGLRLAGDVDLLVRAEDLERAVGIARELGYGPPSDPIRHGGLPELHFELAHPTLPPVEIHWRISWWEDGSFSRELLETAVVGDDGVRRADPAPQLAALLLFYARDGFHGLRMAADIAAYWDAHGDRLSAQALDRVVTSHPQLARPLTAAAEMADRLVGIPEDALLSARPARDRRRDLALRLADWTQEGDPDQLRANIALVGGLIGPDGSAPEFMRRELLSAESARQVPAHAAKTAARWAWALWRVRRGRAWSPIPDSQTALMNR
jgi:putative nucleotidyltransferase-like protein